MKGLKRILLSLCLGCLCLLPLTAVASGAVATGALKEMVYELPSDSGTLYLTVVGSTNDKQYQNLCSLFNATPECRAVRDKYHYTQLAKGSAMFDGRYAKDFTDTPTVRIQTIDGAIVQEWAGASIPANEELKTQVNATCLRGWRQRRQQAAPKNTDTNVVVQPVGLVSGPEEAVIPLWVYGAVLVFGGCVREIQDLRRAGN